MENSRNDTEIETNAPTWRVLVVDNDAVTAADHALNLGRWGYQPYVAQGTGEILVQNALQLARTHNFNLALVDMRLLDDSDGKDVSGLRLVKQLSPLPALVVSGYITLYANSEQVAESGAKGMIGKEQGPRALHRAIQNFFVSQSHSAQQDNP